MPVSEICTEKLEGMHTKLKSEDRLLLFFFF